MKNSFKTIALLTLLSSSLTGCVATAIGGMAVAADSIANRRSIGAQADDSVMELRVYSNANSLIKQAFPNNNASLSVTSYNRKILLLGQVQNEQEKQLAEQAARSETNMEQVYNFINVSSDVRSIGHVNNDTWITSKARAKLLTVSGVYSGQVKVVTFNSIVYLMGILTPEQQSAVVDKIRTIDGIQQVVTLFENYPTTTAQ